MSRGSFAYQTPTECREVLDKIKDRTSFVYTHEPPPVEPEVHEEEAPTAKSEPIESQSIDSNSEPSPELKTKTLEEEDLQPSKFLHNIEDHLFEYFEKHLELLLPEAATSPCHSYWSIWGGIPQEHHKGVDRSNECRIATRGRSILESYSNWLSIFIHPMSHKEPECVHVSRRCQGHPKFSCLRRS